MLLHLFFTTPPKLPTVRNNFAGMRRVYCSQTSPLLGRVIVSAVREFLDLYGPPKAPPLKESDNVSKENNKNTKERYTNLAPDTPHKAVQDLTRSESFSSEYRTQKDVR